MEEESVEKNNNDFIVIRFDRIEGLKISGKINVSGGGIFAEAVLCVLKKAKKCADKSGRELTSEIVTRLALSFEEHPSLPGSKKDNKEI